MLVAWVAGGALLGACASARRPQPIGPVIKALHFRGQEAFSARELREKIATEATSVLPLSESRRLDPVLWDADRLRLERFYRAEGYHRVVVTPAAERRGDDAVALTVTIDEGPRSRVGALDVHGLEAVPDATRRDLLAHLPLAPGSPFTEAAWAATKATVLARLRQQAFAHAAVGGRALVELEAARVDLTVEVILGPHVRFGAVVVTQGRPPHVPERFIAEQVRAAAPQGSPFSPAALAAAQRRLVGLGVFSSAEVGPGEGAGDVLPISARTQTMPFRSVRAGGGGRIDQVRNELRLVAGWSHANAFGGLRKLSVDGRVGWTFLPSAIALLTDQGATVRHGPVYDVTTSFEQPRFLARPTLRLLVHAESERRLEEAFSAFSGRSGPALLWQPHTALLLSTGYELFGARLVASGRVDPRDAPLTLGCDENPCVMVLSYLRQRAVWDVRDDPLAPSRGLYAALELIEGGGPLGGRFTYLRAQADLRAYATRARVTLAVRAQAGGLYPASGRPEETPIEHRFFAGGASSMRGFGSNRLSPMVGVQNGGGPVTAESLDDTLAIGGGGLLLGSVEARLRLSPNVSVAAFWDSGVVTRRPPELADFARLFHAPGLGLRWRTPIGPVRIDLARRLPGGGPRTVVIANDLITPLESGSCFGFGRSPPGALRDGACALHLSIGEAF